VSYSADAIELHVPEDTDPSSVRPLADELVRRTHEVFDEQLSARRAIRQHESDLATRYADVLQADPRAWVTSVSAEVRHDRRGVLRIQTDLGEGVPPRLVEDALNRARPPHSRSHISFRDGELVFTEDTWTPDEVLSALERASADATEAARAQANEREATRNKREELVRGVSEAFSDIQPG